MSAQRHIIVVDPCDETRTVLARRLRAQGYTVDDARDPATGADMALCSPPAAVIADLWMPSISGLQLCRLLRSEPATADVAILLCADSDEPQNRFWAERAGANAYVPKRRTAELVRALSSAIRAQTPSDPFFFQLGGGTVDIRDRIARHLDAALFDSIIASEVRALATCGTFERLFDHFVQFLTQVTAYRWVALSLGDGEHFAIHYNAQADAAAVEAEAAAALSMPEAGACLRIVDGDAVSSPLSAAPIVRQVPFGAGTVGKLAVSPRSATDVSAATRLVSLVASELGGPMRMASLVEEAQRLAATDLLTGLMTRRAFFSAMNLEFARSERHFYPLSLVVFDVDHFKLINDRHGHATGDRVLAALGKLMKTTILRKTDMAARWGGEEFVVAYLSTPKSGALIAAERLRKAIESLVVLDDQGMRVSVTASFGLAEHATGESLQTVVDRADRGMYASKNGGRNRITLLEGDAPIAAQELVAE